MEPIHISINKRKLNRLFGFSVVFLLTSLLFIIKPEWFLSFLISSPMLIIIIGIIGLIFFGITLLYSGRKLLDTRLGLVIKEEGIIENVSAFRFGLIEWEDVIEFESIKVMKSDLILIKTDKTDKYLQRVESKVFQKIAKQNLNRYQTPLFINSDLLAIESGELERLLKDELIKRNKS